MHELSLSRNSAYSGRVTEGKCDGNNGIGSCIGSTIGSPEDDDAWPLIPLVRLSVFPSEILRRNVTALDRLIKENKEMGFNEVELNEYIAKQRKCVIQELSIRDVNDSGSLATKERERTEQGCNSSPADEEHWEVPVSASNPALSFHLKGDGKKIISQPACRGKQAPRRKRGTICGRRQSQQVSSMAEQHHKVIKPAMATRATTSGASYAFAAPVPAFVVASAGGKRRSQPRHRRRALDEEIRTRTPLEVEAALRKERESLRASRRKAALERLSARRKERMAEKEHEQKEDDKRHRYPPSQQTLGTGMPSNVTLPGECASNSISDEDFESISGGSIAADDEEEERSTGRNCQGEEGDRLVDEKDELSGSETFVALHGNQNSEDEGISDDEHLSEERGEEKEAHLQAQHDKFPSDFDLEISSDMKVSADGMNRPGTAIITELIPINKVEELIMCGLYCLTTTFTDEEEEEVIISRSTQRETTTLPFTLSKIYRTFESVFTAHANPRVVGGGKLRRARRNRWLVTDIIETLAIQKRLYTEYFDVLRDYKMMFCNGGGEAEDDEDGPQLDANQRKFDSGARGYWSGNPAARTLCVVSQNQSEMCEICKDVLLGGTKPSEPVHRGQDETMYDCYPTGLGVWEELPSGLGIKMTWNLLWTSLVPAINYKTLLVWQRVNHFQNNREVVHKDRLKHNIARFTCHGGKVGCEWGLIMPTTFVLPHEYTSFVKAFLEIKEANNNSRNEEEGETNNLWIMKPVARSRGRGRGIKIVHDFGSVRYSEKVILQKYVHKPLLLNGYKFDLRLYVLVTSFQPVEAFIFKEGLARLSTELYTLKVEEHGNQFVHLTNSSIQQHNLHNLGKDEGTGIRNDNPLKEAEQSQEGAGTKTTLSFLWRKLQDNGITVSTLWKDICKVVVKTLLCCEPRIPNQPNAFELFGFDIVVDEDLKPWLLEVNYSPDMARRSDVDKKAEQPLMIHFPTKIKEAVIQDTVRLVDPLPFDRDALLRIVKRRLGELRGKCRQQTGSCSASVILEKDLERILQGARPRSYGEMPVECGGFERICPGTDIFERYATIRERAGLGPQQ